jgi:hypothetical protein
MGSTTTFATMLYLLKANAPITSTSIKSPNSVNYSYATWVYVNTWGNGAKTLFSVVDSASQRPLLTLKLGSTTLTMSADISVAGNLQNIMVTNNFPVQKWVYLIVSVDGSVVDFYLDGKLVVSTVLKNALGQIMNSDVSNTPQINFGNGYDIYLSKFQRWTYATDPQTAWNSYYAGNGQSTSFAAYGANLAISKNNIVQREVKLF